MWQRLKSLFKKGEKAETAEDAAKDESRETAPPLPVPLPNKPSARPNAGAAPAVSPVERWLKRLRAVAHSDRDAEPVLAELRDAPEQGRVLERFFAERALGEVTPNFRYRASLLLVERGDVGLAQKLAEGLDVEGAFRLRADILERAGNTEAALAEVERGLARAYGDGSLRDARERLFAKLGRSAKPKAAAAPGETLALGETRSTYELRAPVGRGGSATVFEAYDPTLARRVALKAYHRAREDAEVLLHEARVSALLAGPGVVFVYDVVPDDGLLVLEWAGHGSLKDVLGTAARHRELWPVEGWLGPLVESMARVHRAGWVHGDLKPSNILLGDAGPIVADFGLAARLGEPHPGGTRGYRSPERERGATASASDDVFALGVILGQALEHVRDVGEGTSATVARWRELARAWTSPQRPLDATRIVLVGSRTLASM